MSVDFNVLQLVVLVFGVLPIALIFLWKFTVGFVGEMILGRRPKGVVFQGWPHWYQLPATVPWADLGGSVARLVTGAGRAVGGQRAPRFTTVRCEAVSISRARVRLSIDFQLQNPALNRELVIDDLHVRPFERDAHAPPLATISFYGAVWLKQDNTMFKERRAYSLRAGDGYVIRLVSEATRIEAAPAYGSYGSESPGVITVVFGLLLDYYFNTPGGPERYVLPSDSLYLFQGRTDSEPTLLEINARTLPGLRSRNAGNQAAQGLIGRLDGYLSDHHSFDAAPSSDKSASAAKV